MDYSKGVNKEELNNKTGNPDDVTVPETLIINYIYTLYYADQ